ncbi:MAG: hypothetical protein V9G19_27885 [Tetrasphaera sp.]
MERRGLSDASSTEIERRNAAFVARGEAPYEIVGLEGLYEPLVNPRTHPLVPVTQATAPQPGRTPPGPRRR